VRRSEPCETSIVRSIAWATVTLALFVRVYWVLRVQSPYDAIYSDMQGYVDRANAELGRGPTLYPRVMALYPYGAHYVYAALFRVIGFEHRTVIGLVQAALTAAPGYFLVLFASRLVTSERLLFAVGILFAAWQPVVWCVGYFLSEVPFLSLLFLNAWLCVRFAEQGKRPFALGLTGAVLFTIRPQFVLTFALLAVAYVIGRRKVAFGPRAVRRLGWVLAPWVVIVGFSAVRHRHFTGHWGLISENGAMNRFFADTTVAKLEARWTDSRGGQWFYWFESPAKKHVGERDVARINAYVAEPDVLDELRRHRLRGKSLAWRVKRALLAVRLLWDKNDPWPEVNRAPPGLRLSLHLGFGSVVRWVLLPLACLGAVVARKGAAYVVVMAHLLTLVVLAMLFFPEARYRVPYDPFLLVLAAAAVGEVARLVAGAMTARDGG
jgi:hypothetical protein